MRICFGVVARVVPVVLVGAALLGGCAPEVGSARWCEAMKDKPSGDWSANEALEYARSCVLK